MSYRSIINNLACSVIGYHLILTMLENTPDEYNQNLQRFAPGWALPKWRFFAPNPGNMNVHFLVRGRVEDTKIPEAWRDITPKSSHTIWAPIWNPNSRSTKVIFDAMQQLSHLRGNDVPYAWVRTTSAYKLLSQYALEQVGGANECQFAIINFLPNEEGDQIEPVITSMWLQNT